MELATSLMLFKVESKLKWFSFSSLILMLRILIHFFED
jgi:hypothetical protein